MVGSSSIVMWDSCLGQNGLLSSLDAVERSGLPVVKKHVVLSWHQKGS